MLCMGTPRRPRRKEQQSADERLREQRATLAWIHSRFRRKGMADDMVRALVTAYDAQEAGEGLVKEAEQAHSNRPDLLVLAIEQSEKTHALLHAIFGARPQQIDLKDSRQPRRGARSKQLEYVGRESCDLAKGDCGRLYPKHVRQHAKFCGFLHRELTRARKLAKKETDARKDIDAVPILKSKGAIANFLVADIGLSPGHIALFTLVDGDAQMELPIKPERLTHQAHAISQALSDWRRRQAKPPRARKT